MDIGTFYTDHWKDIEEARIERYEQMFVWQDAQKVLLEPAELALGQRVLDVGSGPGFFAQGLVSVVGETGQVDGVDINARFVADANDRAQSLKNLAFHHVEDHVLPFADGTFDCVICKNVLEYVPNLQASLGEVYRVVKPGGRVLVIDSDWGFVIVQPWDQTTVSRFFQAASPAFNEPLIGRKVGAVLQEVGFEKPRIRLSPFVDQTGRGLHVLRNMAGYIETFNTMPKEEVEELLGQVEATAEKDQFLFCLPQFLVCSQKS